MSVGGVFVTLRAFTDKFKVDMAKARASVDKFRKSTVNINRQLKKVGKEMNKVGRSMSASFTLPIVAAGGLAVKTFADFEQSMAKVKAVSGATGDEFKKLENLAKDLGESTRFTAVQIAELQLNYSKLGFVPDEIQKITKATLNLSLATGEDLASSAEVAGSTLRGLGLKAEEMPRVIDVMAASFSATSLDLESFRESMKLIAPTAVATGRDMETVTAQLGILAKNGIKGSIAGTQLSRVFIELNKKGITLDQAMNRVNNSSNGLATSIGLVKDRGSKALLILAKQRKELGPLEDALRNSSGAAEEMARIMDDTLQGSLLKVQSALEGAAIELGQTLAPVIKKVGGFIAEMAQRFSALNPETKKTITIVAGLVAAVGPLLVVLGVMASTVIPALISGFALLLSPVVLVAGAIAAIGASAVIVTNHLNRLTGANQGLLSTLEDADEAAGSELAAIEKLVTIAKSDQLSREKRQEAINELQKTYPDYLKNLTLEEINTGATSMALEKLKNNILSVSRARALEGKIQELQKRRIEAVTSAGESELTTFDKAALVVTKFASALGAANAEQARAMLKAERLTEATEDIDNQITALVDTLATVEKQQIKTNATTKTAAELAREAAEAEAARAKAALAASNAVGIGVLNTEGKKDIDPFAGMGDTNAGMSQATTELMLYQEKLKKTADAQALLAEKAHAVGDAVGSAFQSMGARVVASFGEAETGMGRFAQAMAGTAIQLIAQLLSASIAQSILGATISGTATGPAAVIATPVFIATAIGGILGAFASIPAFASGTNFAPGGMALVGERGPEIVNLPRGSQVIPNDQIGGGGGTQNVIFTIKGTELRGVLRNADIRSGFTSSGANLKG